MLLWSGLPSLKAKASLSIIRYLPSHKLVLLSLQNLLVSEIILFTLGVATHV